MRSDKLHYRGYGIQARREWSNWCASVHPTRPDLPILAQSTLSTLSLRKEDAVAAAKNSIDELLTGLEQHVA
jgi:hypothetical protein